MKFLPLSLLLPVLAVVNGADEKNNLRKLDVGNAVKPSDSPTSAPTDLPSKSPTLAPTKPAPSESPTISPTKAPSNSPTATPTDSPTTKAPSSSPTATPTDSPTTKTPTRAPSTAPTDSPTTKTPTRAPSTAPSVSPTVSMAPSLSPSSQPTVYSAPACDDSLAFCWDGSGTGPGTGDGDGDGPPGYAQCAVKSKSEESCGEHTYTIEGYDFSTKTPIDFGECTNAWTWFNKCVEYSFPQCHLKNNKTQKFVHKKFGRIYVKGNPHRVFLEHTLPTGCYGDCNGKTEWRCNNEQDTKAIAAFATWINSNTTYFTEPDCDAISEAPTASPAPTMEVGPVCDQSNTAEFCNDDMSTVMCHVTNSSELCPEFDYLITGLDGAVNQTGDIHEWIFPCLDAFEGCKRNYEDTRRAEESHWYEFQVYANRNYENDDRHRVHLKFKDGGGREFKQHNYRYECKTEEQGQLMMSFINTLGETNYGRLGRKDPSECTTAPSFGPTAAPVPATPPPTGAPTTLKPTPAPTTPEPSSAPTSPEPSSAPTTSEPSSAPTTQEPTSAPTMEPSLAPTAETMEPSLAPTAETMAPTVCSDSYFYNPPLYVLVVIDISYSTYTTDFTTNGEDIGDVNGDGKSNTVLDAEIMATLALLNTVLETDGLNNTNVNVGLVTFETSAFYHGHYNPLNDTNDGINDELETMLRDIRTKTEDWDVYYNNVGYTNMDDALDKSIEYFTDEDRPELGDATKSATNLMVFLGDGKPNVRGDGDDEDWCPAGVGETMDCTEATANLLDDADTKPWESGALGFCTSGDTGCYTHPAVFCARGFNASSTTDCKGKDVAKTFTSELLKLDELKTVRMSVGVGSQSDTTVGSALYLIDNNPYKQQVTTLEPRKVLGAGDLIHALRELCPENTQSPTDSPSASPTDPPSPGPSAGPSVGPSAGPSASPSAGPSVGPSAGPSAGPSVGPSAGPSAGPSVGPSAGPSVGPSAGPSVGPSAGPSAGPSVGPTLAPVTAEPTAEPSAGPSPGPTIDICEYHVIDFSTYDHSGVKNAVAGNMVFPTEWKEFGLVTIKALPNDEGTTDEGTTDEGTPAGIAAQYYQTDNTEAGMAVVVPKSSNTEKGMNPDGGTIVIILDMTHDKFIRVDVFDVYSGEGGPDDPAGTITLIAENGDEVPLDDYVITNGEGAIQHLLIPVEGVWKIEISFDQRGSISQLNVCRDPSRTPAPIGLAPEKFTRYPSAGPSAGPSVGPSAGPSVGPSAGPSVGPTVAPAPEEPVCPDDIKLQATTGDTKFDNIPIRIISRDINTVTLEITNPFTETIAWLFPRYVAGRSPECVGYEVYNSTRVETITAECMQHVPLSVVDIFVLDEIFLDSALDIGTLPECCHGPPNLPTVQYTYTVYCVPQCPDGEDGLQS